MKLNGRLNFQDIRHKTADNCVAYDLRGSRECNLHVNGAPSILQGTTCMSTQGQTRLEGAHVQYFKPIISISLLPLKPHSQHSCCYTVWTLPEAAKRILTGL